MGAWNLLMLVLCLPVQFWFGWRFLSLGWKGLRAFSPDMNSLVMLGTLAAFTYSTVVTFWPNWLPADAQHVYFESAAVVITLVLLGKYLEARSKSEAGNAMRSLLKLQPAMARLILPDGSISDVSVSTIRTGDRIEVRPGETIPLDGIIENGSTAVDESMITGESIPVEKSPNDKVTGGTLNQFGNIRFRVTSVGSDTTLAKIVQFVEQAQASKPKLQSISDSVVAYFVPVVLVIALLTAASWLFGTGKIELALLHAVAVLIVACPCAMGLAVPTSVMVGSGRAAQLGILFRQSTAIENLANSTTIAVDKTGTVTQGKPHVSKIVTTESLDENAILQWTMDVQRKSEHPLAKAIVAHLDKRFPEASTDIRNFTAVPGFGVEAEVYNAALGSKENAPRLIQMGSERFMNRLEISLDGLRSEIQQCKAEGASLFYIAIDSQIAGMIALEDSLKPDSKNAISSLSHHNKKVLILSGDQTEAVRKTGLLAGLSADQSLGEMLPEAKAEKVRELMAQGEQVAFVGDGLNDAPALVSADVGVAIGTGTDLAIESADVVLMSGDLSSLVRAVEISRAIVANIYQNLGWAFGYNILLIPLATGLLEPLFGWKLSPIHAAIAMSLSSFFVVSNALRLRNFKPSFHQSSPIPN